MTEPTISEAKIEEKPQPVTRKQKKKMQKKRMRARKRAEKAAAAASLNGNANEQTPQNPINIPKPQEISKDGIEKKEKTEKKQENNEQKGNEAKYTAKNATKIKFDKFLWK